MTPQEFDFLWKRNFPKSIPLPHLFRQDYSPYWLRIKSLPNNKRYPTNDKDINVLLERQNTIITEILGNNSKILGITGEYDFDKDNTAPHYSKSRPFQQFNFIELNPISMYELSRTEFKPGDTYRLYLTELLWAPNKYNDLLEAIAYDEARMFFMCVDKKCLIAPYDGGIDFIITDPQVFTDLTVKYKEWITKPVEYKV